MAGWVTLAIALGAGPAAADAAAEARVRTFLQDTDRAGTRHAALEASFAEHLDLAAFAERTAPDAAWRMGDAAARTAYLATVLCRLAEGAAGVGETEWRILGSNDRTRLSTVGVLVTEADGGERRVLFDVLRETGRILDIRAEGGRLSQELGEDFRREAGDPDLGAPAAGWLGRVGCDSAMP